MRRQRDRERERERLLAFFGPWHRPSISLKASGQEASPRQAVFGRTEPEPELPEPKPPKPPALGTGTELAEALELTEPAFCQLSMMLATWPTLVGLELP